MLVMPLMFMLKWQRFLYFSFVFHHSLLPFADLSIHMQSFSLSLSLEPVNESPILLLVHHSEFDPSGFFGQEREERHFFFPLLQPSLPELETGRPALDAASGINCTLLLAISKFARCTCCSTIWLPTRWRVWLMFQRPQFFSLSANSWSPAIGKLCSFSSFFFLFFCCSCCCRRSPQLTLGFCLTHVVVINSMSFFKTID